MTELDESEFVSEVENNDIDGVPDDEKAALEAQEDGTGEPDVEEEETPEPEDEQAEGSAEAVARMDRALHRASQNYSKALTKIEGLFESGWFPCPLCAEHAPGLLSPMPPSDAAVAATRPLIGLPDLSTYAEDRYARKCDRCEGRGRTLTGSQVPQYATIQCQDCGGTGFQSADPAFTKQANGVLAAPVIPATHEDPEPAYELPLEARLALQKMLGGAEVAAAGGIPGGDQ